MNRDKFQKQFNVIRMIWLAMLGSLAIYLAVSLLAGDAVRKGVGEEIPLDMMRRILIGISAVELILIDVFRKRMLKPGQAGSPEAAVQKYSITSLVSYAVAESIGIFGLVLYFLGDAVHYLYFLMAASALAMIYYRPKFETIEALVNPAKRYL